MYMYIHWGLGLGLVHSLYVCVPSLHRQGHAGSREEREEEESEHVVRGTAAQRQREEQESLLLHLTKGEYAYMDSKVL